MAITKQDSQRMIRLAREGKQISKIATEDFPKLGYWDVYIEVYGSGERSARGIKRMITNRFDSLDGALKSDRRALVEELRELVWHLYENHKSNQKKIDKIRKALVE